MAKLLVRPIVYQSNHFWQGKIATYYGQLYNNKNMLKLHPQVYTLYLVMAPLT